MIRLFENPKSKTTLIATAFNCYIAAVFMGELTSGCGHMVVAAF